MEFLEDSEGVRVQLLGDVLAYHHYGPLVPGTARVIERSRRAAADAVRSLRMVVIMEAGVSPPDGPTRELLGNVLRDNARYVRAQAYVMHGEGFTGAAVRAALTGLLLVSRATYPVKVFATLAPASAWLAARDGAGTREATALAEQLERLVRTPR